MPSSIDVTMVLRVQIEGSLARAEITKAIKEDLTDLDLTLPRASGTAWIREAHEAKGGN